MGDINKHFSHWEFNCKCGRCPYSHGQNIDPRIPEIMLEIRLALMRPITVSSGCRCDFHNVMSGGSRRSKHKKSQGFVAADFLVFPSERYLCVEIAQRNKASFGISKKGFMHIDFRPGDPMAFPY